MATATTPAEKAALVQAGAATRWTPGHGGPGRPRRIGPRLPSPQELASPNAKEALDVVLAIMRGSNEDETRLRAARLIIETAKPDDDEKVLRLLEDRLRELQAEADARKLEATP